MRTRFWLCWVLLCIAVTASAEQRSKAYEAYIKKYRELAVYEMRRYHIPASITLAQGLLESGAGQGKLARISNNHFGIKCGLSWDGPSVSYDDDARGECFRKYKHVKDSYTDHSKFLRTGSRYAPLFRLKITDYKGWARGLKRAGYATDPQYADRLIKIIELYNLDLYDHKGGLKFVKEIVNLHQPYLANELVYIVAQPGDTFESIAKEFDISRRKLCKWNELPKYYRFKGGEVLYLEKKHRRATKEHILHVVKVGDSMYSIAQMYGVRLDRLYKMNGMKANARAPQVGDFIRLR